MSKINYGNKVKVRHFREVYFFFGTGDFFLFKKDGHSSFKVAFKDLYLLTWNYGICKIQTEDTFNLVPLEMDKYLYLVFILRNKLISCGQLVFASIGNLLFVKKTKRMIFRFYFIQGFIFESKWFIVPKKYLLHSMANRIYLKPSKAHIGTDSLKGIL